MSHGSRPDRVGDMIRNELGVQLTQHVRDPGVRHVTVTHVRMSKDLQQARVFYIGPENEQDKRDTSRALKRVRPFLRRQLGRQLELRHVPELRFEYDDSAEREDRVARLFERIADEQPGTPDPEP